MELKLANSKTELSQILVLQNENHFENLSKESKMANGFVTVRHNISLLEKMNSLEKQVIAVLDDKVIGYALVMLKELRNAIPVLSPMFDSFEKIKYNNTALPELNYYVMGQICIAKDHRGSGVFQALYEKHKAIYSEKYDLCVTEVSTSNRRSMRAHEKIGFEIIHTYRDTQDEWNIIVWNWKTSMADTFI